MMVFIELTTYDIRIPSPVGTVLRATRAVCMQGPSAVPRNVRFSSYFRVSGSQVPIPRLIPVARIVLDGAGAKRSPHTRSPHY